MFLPIWDRKLKFNKLVSWIGVMTVKATKGLFILCTCIYIAILHSYLQKVNTELLRNLHTGSDVNLYIKCCSWLAACLELEMHFNCGRHYANRSDSSECMVHIFCSILVGTRTSRVMVCRGTTPDNSTWISIRICLWLSIWLFAIWGSSLSCHLTYLSADFCVKEASRVYHNL